MCGINFIYKPDADPDQLLALTRDSLEQMRHRGPDADGLVHGDHWAMGHRRLSIIDLSASKQPMTDPQGRYHLSFNGEIYNYQSLRSRLEKNWHFKTHGDTEVILAGLLIHGRQFLEQMEGMWAIAFWDSIERKLLLSRDRMGKKPLFYTTGREYISCSSELPSLLKLHDTDLKEDIDSTADYFRYGFYLPGTTAYRNIREVLPGHHLEWSPGYEPTISRYWQIIPNRYFSSKQQASDELGQALISSVERRMVADVEVGAFLSGGVDSSLIVSIMCKDLGIHPQTFTIGFKEKAYDETAYARQISDLLGTSHHQEYLTHWNREHLQDLILNHIGQPFADSSLLPTSQVSALASRHIKVALSGDGGDELFSGYQRYQARVLLQWFNRLPTPLQKAALKMIDSLPEPMTHHSRSLLKKAHLFSSVMKRQRAETPYIAPAFYSHEDFTHLAPELLPHGHAAPGLPHEARLDDIGKMMLSDCLVYLPQDILTKVDRASMAHSLETRAPFLDSKVIETAFAMPRKWHRRGFSGKRSLRTAFPTHLPVNIWERNKQGFAVPVHDWFRKELGEMLVDMLDKTDNPLNRSSVTGMLDEHRHKNRDHGYRLWSIYVYLLWKQSAF